MDIAQPVPFETTARVRDTCLCLHTQRAARVLARRFDAALKPTGLTNEQFSLLMALNRPNPASMSELADLLGADRTTLTAALKPLFRRGMAEARTDDNDRRVRRIALTAEGGLRLSAALDIWSRAHGAVEADLEGADFDHLRDDLRQLSGLAPQSGPFAIGRRDMNPEVTTFRWVPPFAQGYVRDLRIRWALEEAAIPYEVALIGGATDDPAAYRRRQPLAVPAYRDDEVEMFESGAIVLHIAGKSRALSPVDAAGRARVTTWVLAALNSVEPHAQNFIEAANSDEAWAAERRPAAEALLTERLDALSAWLGDKPYLEGGFTAGDLIMTTVLRELADSGVLARFPNLDAHRQRCEQRPAFGKALEAQMALYRETAPA